MKEGLWLKPVAVLLGILAWLYVNIFSSTPITREFKVKIAYLNVDTTKKFKIIPENPELKVRVRGPRGVFIQTKVEDNTFASVDLLNSHGGKLTLPVTVILPSNSNLELISKEPAQLVINSIKMATKDIDVKVNIVGAVPEGYLSSEPMLSPEKLSVTAPEETIGNIRECAIDLYLDDIKRSISELRQTHIVYKDGRIEGNMKGALIDIANNSVKLDIAVREGYPEKEVSVLPEILNKPPEGRKLDELVVSPEKVVITGPLRVINNIKDLPLEPIDLQTIVKSSTVQAKIKTPDEVRVVGLPSVAVTFKYSDVLVYKLVHNLPLEIAADGNQLVDCPVTTYTIELQGYIDDLNALKPSELKNIIRMKGMASGTHKIKLDTPYGLSDRLKVKEIIPEFVDITVNLLEKVKEEELQAVATSTQDIKNQMQTEIAITAPVEATNETTEKTSTESFSGNEKLIASPTGQIHTN